MALDIRGSLKNTRISENQFVIFEELFSNAIDSYLIRKNSETESPPLEVKFEIEFFPMDMVSSDRVDIEVRCTDNGAGMGEMQEKAFITKDSTFKDDLRIPGIGKCKGSGRVQFFHFFKTIKINSVFDDFGTKRRRKLNIHEAKKEITKDDFVVSEVADGELCETKFSLSGLTEKALKKHFPDNDVRSVYSAKAIRDHLFLSFLQRLILLREQIGEFVLEVEDIFQDRRGSSRLTHDELPDRAFPRRVSVVCAHVEYGACNPEVLNISHYSFDSSIFQSFEHDVALCANNSIVLSLINTYIKGKSDRKRPINNKFHLILIEGDYLESTVNVQRDNFDIPKNCTNRDVYLSNNISFEDILESIEDYIYEILTPNDFDREALIASTNEKYGISKTMIAAARVKVHFNDSEDNIASRVLKNYQQQIIEGTGRIFDLKTELMKLDPKGDEFREKVNNISWAYTSNLKQMDMANLSQLIVRRAAMLEVLGLAVRNLLQIQGDEGKRRESEKIIHNIFFPMGKDSDDGVDHDVWILNEEYHYFRHIASDKALASIPWDDTDLLFTPDIDEELERSFTRNNIEHSKKRPDIAIFNEEGSAIIIEFKAPGVELQEHVNDLMQYAVLLASKSRGRIQKFYGYLIGDTIDQTRIRGYQKFASGKGWFGTEPVVDHATNATIGELYSEILFYEDIISKAGNRLSVYKNKLNMEL